MEPHPRQEKEKRVDADTPPLFLSKALPGKPPTA